MTMVKIAMPRPNTATVRKTLPSGITIRVSEPIASPTPAAANSTPRLASICGSTAAQPMASISRRPSWSGAMAGGLSQAKMAPSASSTPRPRKT